MWCRLQRLACVLLLFVSSGCPSPLTTRLPQVLPSNKYVERNRYERHDPFELEDMGPSMMIRPRGFESPRNPARRAAEQRTFQGLNMDRVPAGPTPPVSQYPGVVRD
jgi:hypothetical protein